MTTTANAHLHLPARLRRDLLDGAHPRPAGRVVAIAAATTLLYVGEKIYMAAIGKIGMPGKIAPQSVQDNFAHPGLAQAGNAAVGMLAVLIALATVMRWGDRIPRLPLLGAVALTALMLSVGAATNVVRSAENLHESTLPALFDVTTGLAQITAWCVVVTSYAVRSYRNDASAAVPQ